MGFGGHRLLILFLAGCLAAGCVSNEPTANMTVTPSALSVGAPSALTAFCKDVPSECGHPATRKHETTPDLTAFDQDASRHLQPSQIAPVTAMTAAVTDAEVPRIATAASSASRFEDIDLTNSSLIFQLLMAKSALEANQASEPASLFRIERSRTLEDAITRINRRINRAIVPAEDRQAYGVEDRWAMPLSYQQRGQRAAFGDCEDYALEKRRALIDDGIDPRALALAIVHKQDVGLHAVLILHTDEGDLVLDNLTGRLKSPAESGYEFILVQSGQHITEWAVASLVAYTPINQSSLVASLAKQQQGSMPASDFVGPPV